MASQETYGTLGAIVQSKTGLRQVGFLTNRHVAVDLDYPSQKMFHPLPPNLGPGVYLGAVERATSFITDDLWYGIFASMNPGKKHDMRREIYQNFPMSELNSQTTPYKIEITRLPLSQFHTPMFFQNYRQYTPVPKISLFPSFKLRKNASLGREIVCIYILGVFWQLDTIGERKGIFPSCQGYFRNSESSPNVLYE